MNIRMAFRKWQKAHPNIMTPHIISLRTSGNIVIELSEGTGIENELIYGVTPVRYLPKKRIFKTLPGGKTFYSKEKARKYMEKLARVKFRMR